MCSVCTAHSLRVAVWQKLIKYSTKVCAADAASASNFAVLLKCFLKG